MKRTAIRRLFPLLSLAVFVAALPAQDKPPAAEPKPKVDAIGELVQRMRATESKALRVRIELSTEGSLPGGDDFRTKGSLRVLRSEQGALLAAQAVMDCTFAGGVQSHMESVKNPDGMWTFETNPVFGEVLLHYDRELVQDLEWAGEVLQRADLPGASDSRAAAPLGSEMVADLAQRYELQAMGRHDRAGQDGTWFGGDRKPGLGQESDADLPIADRVEMFVRTQDSALLEAVWLQAGKPIQRIVVDTLVLGEPMPVESFVLDTKGKKPKDVREHAPEWSQIQQILQSAKEKAGEGNLPPSERKKKEAKPAGGDGK